jgi:hypothetical protein
MSKEKYSLTVTELDKKVIAIQAWKAKNIQNYIKKIEAEAAKRIKELNDK